MFIVAVEFKIKPENADQFKETILQQAANSLALESECHQFDVCYAEGDLTKCFLYEKYTDEAAFEAHQKTDHFKKFSSAVEPWVAAKELKLWLCEA